MSTNKSKIKSIVTVNAYSKKYYTLKEQQLKPLKRLTYNSSNFVASYVNSKDLISATIDISRSIPNEDIEDIIEIKAYEELGLDQANEYVIKYIERESSGDIRNFDLFIAEPVVLEETFEETIKETKYIDLLIPAPLLYRSVYSRKILASEGVHCFIYFGQNDAFVAFYKNGQHLYNKSIEYSLGQIYDKYCELSGDRVNEEEFFSILESEGLKTIHADYQQNLMKLFGDIFISINDIVIYAKRAFDLSSIDQMFVGSTKGPIIGLDEYSENYLGLQSTELNFDFNLDSDEWYTDQLQYMLAVASMEYMENTEGFANLTIFQRAPAFHKRASGQFIIATSMAVMLGISYPLYFLVGSYMNDATNLVLTNQESALKAESGKYKKILGAKKKEIKRLDGIIADKSKIYHAKEKTLTSIYDKKVNYHLRSDFIAEFSNIFHKFNIYVSQIRSRGKQFDFAIYSKDAKNITELIKYISSNYMNRIISISTETISTMAYVSEKYSEKADPTKTRELKKLVKEREGILEEKQTIEKFVEDFLPSEKLDSEKSEIDRLATAISGTSESGTSEYNVAQSEYSAVKLAKQLRKQKKESLPNKLLELDEKAEDIELEIKKAKDELVGSPEEEKVTGDEKMLLMMATGGASTNSLDNDRDKNEKYFMSILKVELR